MQKIYLIRHTKVAVEAGHFYGRTDVPLADSFPQEAQRIRELLPAQLDMPVWSSPLSRCRLLADHLFPSYQCDPRLLELDFGDWEMRSFSEIPDLERDHFLKNFHLLPPPKGEHFASLQARAIEFLSELLEKDHPEMAIVAHAGVIRALLCHVMQAPLSRLYSFDLDYGAVSSLVRDQKSLRVHKMNG